MTEGFFFAASGARDAGLVYGVSVEFNELGIAPGDEL
jgi:hypothetical protein